MTGVAEVLPPPDASAGEVLGVPASPEVSRVKR